MSLEHLILEHDITQMTSLKDPENFYRILESEITTEVARREIVTKSFYGQTLYNPNVSITESFSKTFRISFFHMPKF